MSAPINVETNSSRTSVFWILFEENIFSGLIVLSNCWKPNLFLNFIVFILPKIFFLEQILYNIKQEYKRMQKRRHLETSFQQTDPCCTSEAQPHAFLLSGPASPGTSSATSSPLKKEQPLFTLRQVGMICERLLKEREEKVREEYEEILNTKLAEQYDAFVKFTHDQIMRRYGEQPASYVS
ncbi:akirin-2-like [Leptonychotes weddellii]|uniref:Akirin-2 n=1 Tax=Leptonychotes weddellii TaxID=9713 RepID=A0A2U3Z280_LEPWE|nr:akirin-2-like [Leptonychotes weddellii]